MSDYVVVDTSVLSYFTKSHPLSGGYRNLLGDRGIAVPFQAEGEILDLAQQLNYGDARLTRLQDLLSAALRLPQSDATLTWYTRVRAVRRQINNGAGEGDVWIISSALEHASPLMTHDGNQRDLALALSVEVLSLLREDRAG